MSNQDLPAGGPDPVTKRPRYAMPQGACDSHVHIYGPARRFPFAPASVHLGFDAPKESLVAMHDTIGAQHGVIVHGAPHGKDLSVTLDALGAYPARYRAIVLLDEDVPDSRLEQLHRAGVRGVRYNFVAHLGGPPKAERLQRMAARIGPLGWHVVVHLNPEQLGGYADVLRGLRLPVMFDHMLRIDPAGGVDQEPFRRLVDFLQDGHWVKIAALEKFSRQSYPFRDAVAIGAALIRAAPDRVVWGTDWPHPMVGERRTNDGDLADLIPSLAPDPEMQEKLLVRNPAALYGFS